MPFEYGLQYVIENQKMTPFNRPYFVFLCDILLPSGVINDEYRHET